MFFTSQLKKVQTKFNGARPDSKEVISSEYMTLPLEILFTTKRKGLRSQKETNKKPKF